MTSASARGSATVPCTTACDVHGSFDRRLLSGGGENALQRNPVERGGEIKRRAITFETDRALRRDGLLFPDQRRLSHVETVGVVVGLDGCLPAGQLADREVAALDRCARARPVERAGEVGGKRHRPGHVGRAQRPVFGLAQKSPDLGEKRLEVIGLAAGAAFETLPVDECYVRFHVAVEDAQGPRRDLQAVLLSGYRKRAGEGKNVFRGSRAQRVQLKLRRAGRLIPFESTPFGARRPGSGAGHAQRRIEPAREGFEVQAIEFRLHTARAAGFRGRDLPLEGDLPGRRAQRGAVEPQTLPRRVP